MESVNKVSREFSRLSRKIVFLHCSPLERSRYLWKLTRTIMHRASHSGGTRKRRVSPLTTYVPQAVKWPREKKKKQKAVSRSAAIPEAMDERTSLHDGISCRWRRGHTEIIRSYCDSLQLRSARTTGVTCTCVNAPAYLQRNSRRHCAAEHLDLCVGDVIWGGKVGAFVSPLC